MFKRGLFVLSFVFLFSSVSVPGHTETFFGEFQTGLIELKDFRYPVFVYVPEHVKPGRLYPLLITIPDEGEEPDKTIARWTGAADRLSMIVLAPTYKRLDDLPNSFDRWFFEVKSMAQSIYPVNVRKIFLVGEEGGGAYAAYLAVNYPEEFSAMAVLDGTLGGQFEPLMDLPDRPQSQMPVYVAYHAEDEAVSAILEKRALAFQEKGYVIEIKQFEKGVDFGKRDFKKDLLQWLSEKSENWEAVRKQDQKTFKEKFDRGVKEFFTVGN